MRRLVFVGVFAASLFGSPAYADLDADDYAATAGAASRKEQALIGRRIELEQKEEEARARREAELATVQRAEETTRREARPYAERITEQRCTRCHVAEYFLAARHGWVGWSLVSLRMKYLNGAAEISEEERAAIVAYLVATLHASDADVAKEYLAAGVAIMAPFAIVWVLIFLRRHNNRKRTGMSAGRQGG